MPQCEATKKFDDLVAEVRCGFPADPPHRQHKIQINGWDYEWYDDPN